MVYLLPCKKNSKSRLNKNLVEKFEIRIGCSNKVNEIKIGVFQRISLQNMYIVLTSILKKSLLQKKLLSNPGQ